MTEATTQPTISWLEGYQQASQCFEQRSFEFAHSLVGHPLFAIPRLLELAKRVSPNPKDLYFDAGNVRIDQKWSMIPLSKMTYEEVLHRIDHCKAWMILKHCEQDPEYAQVLKDCSDSFLGLCNSRYRKLLHTPEMLVIISSPNRITPFHIDGECNFLLQVQGSKRIQIYDRNDRAVLAEEEIERFYTEDPYAATYKPGIEPRAAEYDLVAGHGVHIPINCPHWVQNGDGVSVSISINFELAEDARANIYRFNHLLRRRGLSPTPVGKSTLTDAVKSTIYSGYRRLVK